MKASFEVAGRVVVVGQREPAGSKYKTKVVIETSSKPEYPSPVEVEAYGDDISTEAAQLAVGDAVSIKGWVRGRFWEKGQRYFVSLSVSEITVTDKASTTQIDETGENVPF